MKSEPKISIVIINWNGLKDTIECIESLQRIEYSNFDIIVIDNGSVSEDAKEIIKRFNDIRVIELRKNLGFAIANNVGIRVALNNDCDYVLLLNNDTVVDKNFLKEMVDIAENNSQAGILGPKMYFYHDRRTLWYAGGDLNMYLLHRNEGLLKKDSGQYDTLRETDYVAGACMLISKQVFEDIGLLSREYFLGWEDIDFCVAAKRKGYACVYVPDSVIWHKASASFKRHNLGYKQVFFGFRNRIILRYKFLSKWGFVSFIIIQVGIVVPLHIFFYLMAYKDIRRVKSMFRGIIAGIRDMRVRKVIYRIDS